MARMLTTVRGRGRRGAIVGGHGTTVRGVGRVTVGIDIGTTSVKAVAADADGAVVRRGAASPTRSSSPTPDRFEHDPVEAWSAGVLEAWRRVRADDVAAVTVAAMVPSLCGVDDAGEPVTPGLLYGDGRGAPGGTGVDGEAVGFARVAGGEHRRRPASGRPRRWPTTPCAASAPSTP